MNLGENINRNFGVELKQMPWKGGLDQNILHRCIKFSITYIHTHVYTHVSTNAKQYEIQNMFDLVFLLLGRDILTMTTHMKENIQLWWLA